MREEQFIENILSHFKQSASQKNKPFTCDAEIIEIASNLWAITMDEFSADEDMFCGVHPYTLGRNLVTATLSDLFACGAVPQFFMHTVSACEGIDPAFFKGVNEVLEECGCFLIGGDIGGSDSLRYTAVAMGLVENKKYLSRQFLKTEQLLWITGNIGDVNLAALRSEPMPPVELRLEDAAFIRNGATSCIDTSGGLVDALWMLQKVNPGMRIEIDAGKLPFHNDVLRFCEESGLPAIAFAFGGAGEYELLFTTLPQTVVPIDAVKIGKVVCDDDHGIHINTGTKIAKLKTPPPCGRDIKDKQLYINSILEQVNEIVG